jgi:hypothetical protein
MNEIPETMPWVTESFGNKDGQSDNRNIRMPASTAGLEIGLENPGPRRRLTESVAGL